MDESFALSLVPSPDPLPAPWWLIEILEHATFSVHILLANLVVGGCLLALAGGNRSEGLAGKLPTLFALTVTLGVAPLLFLQVQYGHLWYTSSVLMASWWVTLVPLLIFAYYGLYLRRHWEMKAPGRARAVTVVSLFLFLWTGFLLINGLSMMQQPMSWLRWFDEQGGWLLQLSDLSIWPRLLHFVLSSVAVAGLFLAGLARLRRPGSGREFRALRLFAHATGVQVFVGIWYYLAQPSPIRKLFMGGDMALTVLFALGLVVGIALFFVSWRGKLVSTLVLFGVTMAVMVPMRALLRAAHLDGIVEPSELPLKPQYGILAVFLVVLALGVWAVVTMLRWSQRQPEVEARSVEGGQR